MPRSDYQSNMVNVFRTLYVLFVSAIALIWFNQNSLATWWQLTYHNACPWSQLSMRSWSAGETLMQASLSAKNAFIETFNSESIEETGIMEPVPSWPQLHATLPLVLAGKGSPTPAPANNPAASSEAARVATITQNQSVLFIGDSMMEGVAPHAMKMLNDRYQVHGINLSKRSTGLAYPSAFNWPKAVKTALNKPDNVGAMVVFLGPNDPWSMPAEQRGKWLTFKSPAWEESYRNRIRSIIDEAKQHNVAVIWVSPPNMRRSDLNSGMEYLRTLYASEAETAHCIYLSGNSILGYNDTQYDDYREVNGRRIRLRSGDGTHFTPLGQIMIAKSILASLQVVIHENK
ncbi:DUF459 domain-containing protein [Atlantibacter subterranea]|uniref:DUF459 domain-containing protein n=1 Tax=Atlantibacter subterraneus TaxID=255519 RepID=A0A3R9FPU6_9ENTR|nr:DUF459 domain-containing protein [Atlantibacter subterranea]MDA3131262.1 DUF459 domain-containing protein [Atlantibacter subterranea]RSB59609.1 DUF459 domain-containing protein [Atlantibacter subterranea]RSE05570.1 DUF459 domain-containing protein [Atlantibacter subterranea]RSE22543.1 DUF459 domain-containing protein [Atlantibacter subterranea]